MTARFLLVALLAMIATATRAEPFASTYRPLPSQPMLIVNATVLTGSGERIENGNLLLSGGRIEVVGAEPIEAGVGGAAVGADSAIAVGVASAEAGAGGVAGLQGSVSGQVPCPQCRTKTAPSPRRSAPNRGADDRGGEQGREDADD